MAIEIKMPALSPTMEVGTLSKWMVAVGDDVRSGDVIAEIETDKATMEVEAVDDGKMAQIAVADGTENIPVGTVIALLAEDGEDVATVSSASPKPAASKLAPPKEDAAGEESGSAAKEAVADDATKQEPAMDTSKPAPVSPRTSADTKRIFASPLARRIAADKGVDLASLTGSGPHGRILRRDVEGAPASMQASLATTAPSRAVTSSAEKGASTLVPNNQMRKIIASRLQESKQTAPHFYLTIDCNIDTLLESRKALNALADEGIKISVNDMVIRAAAMALMKVPAANASWEGDNTRLFHNADICMAVAVDGGLVTPVIWAAESKGLSELSTISSDLATRARDGKLAAEEFTGGSFTISNLGMFGVREFAAVINPPQGAILAVGAGEQRPVVIDGALSVATMMTVTLSCDHRAVDGAVGAEWLQAFKGFVENPVTMLL
ncbi:pyruvate dehydrogenase complex dihydrolipoamide acetyltransferase [Candidatus Puniceispirillum marinum]|uniref:Acetyltransferase component of pyruvate dehydrogenase complex n=1 Tax=Puniceispirillum marinum (strain IMCC1322) TaxID=488538 RepID=D5BPG8_PUNMI|nr:pyruvate dehydrogenase complex dihydrolipoamide acetyltransferase [Candidatus Puniceispirillum marinum]ADE38450.1 Dihydrolipoamide acetyltransferase, long form [Candidatus Puniceispirillum marinum IMCC1322]